jgi:hypothetical protein
MVRCGWVRGMEWVRITAVSHVSVVNWRYSAKSAPGERATAATPGATHPSVVLLPHQDRAQIQTVRTRQARTISSHHVIRTRHALSSAKLAARCVVIWKKHLPSRGGVSGPWRMPRAVGRFFSYWNDPVGELWKMIAFFGRQSEVHLIKRITNTTLLFYGPGWME